MMKKWLVLICMVSMVVFWSGVGLAEETDEEAHDVSITVNEVAELGIAGDEVSFTVGFDTTAGQPFKVTSTNEDAKYLQYTSIVDTGETRTITVQQTDDLPPGVTLKVTPTTAGGDKQGNVGTAAQNAITLNDIDGATNVVTDIGSCYTGTESSDGVKLTYTLTVENDDVSSLKTLAETGYTVTYTLTEGNGGVN